MPLSPRCARLATTVAALALAVSACGGGDGGDDSGGDSGGDAPPSSANPTAPSATPTDGAPASLTTAWTGDLVGAVVVAEGFVGIEQHDETSDLVMLSAEDGSEVWRHPVEAEGESPQTTLTASPDGSTAYLGVVTSSDYITEQSPEPVLTAYDVATGEEQWSTEVVGGVTDLNTDGVDASAGLILAWEAVVSPEDGSVLREPGGLGDEGAVPLADDRLLVGEFDVHVESADGREIWALDDAELPAQCEPQGENGEAFYEGTFAGVVVVTCYDASGTKEHVGFLEGEDGSLLGGLPITGMTGSEQVSEATHDAATNLTLLSGPIGTVALDRLAGELAWHQESLTSQEFRPGPAYDGLVYGAGAVVSEEDGSVVEDGDWRAPLGITADGVFLFSEDEHTTQVIAMTA